MNRFIEASSGSGSGSGSGDEDDKCAYLLPNIEEVKRKIEDVRVDLAVENIMTLQADLALFIDSGFSDIERKSRKSLERFRRTMKDSLQAELTSADEKEDDIFLPLREKIERLRPPNGADDFIHKELNGIRESIVEYIAGYISEHLHSANNSLLEAKSKVTNQLYTARESIDAFRKSYDVAARLREEKKLRKTIQTHEAKYDKDIHDLKLAKEEHQYTAMLLSKSCAHLREDNASLTETVSDQNDKIGFLQLCLDRAEKNKKVVGQWKSSFTSSSALSRSGDSTPGRDGLTISKPQTPTLGLPPFVKMNQPGSPPAALVGLGAGVSGTCEDCKRLEAEIVNMTTGMQELSAKIVGHDAAIDKVVKEKESAEALWNAAFNAKIQIEAIRDTLQEKVELLTDELDKAVKSGLDMETAVAAATQDLQAATEQNERLKSQDASVKEELSTVKEELTTVKVEISTLTTQIEVLSRQCNELRAEADEDKKTMLKLQDYAKKAKSEKEALQDDIGRLRALNESLQESVGTLTKGLDAASAPEHFDLMVMSERPYSSSSSPPQPASAANSRPVTGDLHEDEIAYGKQNPKPKRPISSAEKARQVGVFAKEKSVGTIPNLQNKQNSLGILNGGPPATPKEPSQDELRVKTEEDYVADYKKQKEYEEEMEMIEEKKRAKEKSKVEKEVKATEIVKPIDYSEASSLIDHKLHGLKKSHGRNEQHKNAYMSEIDHENSGFRHILSVNSGSPSRAASPTHITPISDFQDDDVEEEDEPPVTSAGGGGFNSSGNYNSNNNRPRATTNNTSVISPKSAGSPIPINHHAVQVRRLSEGLAYDHNTIAEAFKTFQLNEELRVRNATLEKEKVVLVEKIRMDKEEHEKTSLMLNLKLKERAILMQELSAQVRHLRSDLKDTAKERRNHSPSPSLSPSASASIFDISSSTALLPGMGPGPAGHGTTMLPKLNVTDISKSADFSRNIFGNTDDATRKKVKKEKLYRPKTGTRTSPEIRSSFSNAQLDKAHTNRVANSLQGEISNEKIVELRTLRQQIWELSKRPKCEKDRGLEREYSLLLSNLHAMQRMEGATTRATTSGTTSGTTTTSTPTHLPFDDSYLSAFGA